MSGIRRKRGARRRKGPDRTAWCLSVKPYWGKPTGRHLRGGGWKRERWLDEAPAPQSRERRSETPNRRLRAPVLYPTGNAGHHERLDRPTGDTLRAPTVTPQRQRLAAQAAHDPDRGCTTLAHLLATDVLREAYQQTSQSSAAGIAGVTAQPYAEPLAENVRDRHARLRSGRDQAAPVERVWIEQDDGGQRPMGKPTFEDKIVQRAVALLLEALYEHDFYDGSDGFRPGRSPHNARQEWRERCMTEGMNWIVDADVSGYFDRIDWTHLRDVRRPRGNEGRRGRLLGTWLRAGGWEEGGLHHPDTGGVQGGTIAPVLAKIFLHQVLDAWLEQEVQPRLKGRSVLSRCADDLVIGGALEADARKLMAVLPKRFARYGLTIPPTKTALMAFRQPAGHAGATPRNGTFDVRGLTHYWALSRRGFWVIKRRTARKRVRRTKKALWRWCRAHRHAPLKDHYQMLGLKWRGHFRYDGIQGNCRLLAEVLRSAEKAGRYGLSRRSSKSAIGWEKFQQRRET
jgi:RNA-directed DNA polymerase